MQVKKQQLELDMEQLTGSKSGNEYVNAVYCHPAYLTSSIFALEKRFSDFEHCGVRDVILTWVMEKQKSALLE